MRKFVAFLWLLVFTLLATAIHGDQVRYVEGTVSILTAGMIGSFDTTSESGRLSFAFRIKDSDHAPQTAVFEVPKHMPPILVAVRTAHVPPDVVRHGRAAELIEM